ncbi:MAG TPA: cytochrome c peroxidase [Ideonella sp.]|nr:cytochrome c peroxidase [Ideonella sp.]
MDTAASLPRWHWLIWMAPLCLAACGGADPGGPPAAPGAGQAMAAMAQPSVEQTAESSATPPQEDIDERLLAELKRQGFTGRVEASLPRRLGRPLDLRLAALGQKLFFDSLLSLHDDNSCAGCHAPATGMGDTQSIAIGIQNNAFVGISRTGPRNQRRTPSVVNTAFYPKLMWNGRFESLSGDPFSNALGFQFPLPEGTERFPPNDPVITHLLMAQAHIPPTELVEVAGFHGVKDLGKRFRRFDDGLGAKVPRPDDSGYRNEPIRQAVLQRLNATPAYRELFAARFADVGAGTPIDFSMVGRAVAEFEFLLVRANAPVDRFARGQRDALSDSEKRGAMIFLGKGRCVQCHQVAGGSNEMFSDFKMHNIGVPQIAPHFGVGRGNVVFDGTGEDEDYGLAQLTGAEADRYFFRTSPLRNVALQPAFFHNGAFTRLEDAVRHHLNPAMSARQYDAARAGVAKDLRKRQCPVDPVLATLDPLLREPIVLDDDELRDLLAFVGNGLLDPLARPAALCRLVPKSLPSGRALQVFEGC